MVVLLSHAIRCWLFSPELATANGYPGFWPAVYTTPFALAIDGDMAVVLFFCISGVALSWPVLQSRNPQRTVIEMSLMRYPRLMIPIAASCGIAYLLFHAGLFSNNHASALSQGDAWLTFMYPPAIESAPFWRFVTRDVFFNYSFPNLNAVLWTMPIEMMGSILLLGIMFVPIRSVRIAIAAGAALWLARTPYFGFAAGMLIAEFANGRNVRAPRSGIALIIGAIGCAMLARTMTGEDALLIRNIAAAAAVLSVMIQPHLQRMFEGRLSLFLGRISFALYLLHVIIICSASSALYIALFPLLDLATLSVVVFVFTLAASVAAAVVFTSAEVRALSAVKAVIRGAVSKAPLRSPLLPQLRLR